MKCHSILIFFLLLSFQGSSQIRYGISTNIFAGFVNGEIGCYFEYPLLKNISAHFSYGHRLYQFNIIQNGGSGPDIKYLAQRGHIIRTGVRKFSGEMFELPYSGRYVLFQTSYWNLHTPKHITRYGANGVGGTLREVISVDKNLINLSVGLGKKRIFNSHFILDIFLAGGISVGEKKIHKYSWGRYDDGDTNLFPPNTFVYESSISPTVDIGINLGYAF